MIYSQTDVRWCNENLKGTVYTIGRWGCLMVSSVNVRNYKNKSAMTPTQANEKLSFTKDGLLIWSSLKNIGLQLVERVYKNDYAKIKAAYDSKDKYVILQVRSSHWVWVVGRYIPYFGWKIADPIDGRTKYTKTYGNQITGFAIVS